MEEKRKKMSRGQVLRIVLICLLAVVFCVSGFMIVRDVIENRRAAQEFEELRNKLPSPPDPTPASAPAIEPSAEPSLEPSAEPTPEPTPEPTEPSEPDWRAVLLEAYADLHEENPDFFGWIKIEGTAVDYPVMFTPNSPEYYLRRNFAGRYSGSGVPFLDGSWYEGCGNYLIYGHHMNNGTMFASLLGYADQAYWEEHPIIRFDRLDEVAEYEVMAAFYSKVYTSADVGVFRYYRYSDLGDQAVFEEYVDQVEAAALYDTGVTAQYGDQLLTLSTCTDYYTRDGRFVVVARKIVE